MASRNQILLRCPHVIWWNLFRELRRRGSGVHESGAFLIGRREGKFPVVKTVLYYDDVDTHALETGIVRLSGHAMNSVWQFCADHRLEVLADIHTHPGGAGQSRSDQQHPMVAVKGHLALIAPRFARDTYAVRDVGAYRYRGDKLWDNLTAPRVGWRGIFVEANI